MDEGTENIIQKGADTMNEIGEIVIIDTSDLTIFCG